MAVQLGEHEPTIGRAELPFAYIMENHDMKHPRPKTPEWEEEVMK